jgi:hypothetical protein
LERALFRPSACASKEAALRLACDLARRIAPLIQKVGASSIAEIEKLIEELQEARDFLQSEGERIQRETAHYTNLTQMASASVKIISRPQRCHRNSRPFTEGGRELVNHRPYGCFR